MVLQKIIRAGLVSTIYSDSNKPFQLFKFKSKFRFALTDVKSDAI